MVEEKAKLVGEFLSAKQFRSLKICDNHLKFQRLHLKSKEFEKYMFLRKAVKSCLKGKNLEQVFSDYKREWFDSELQFETEQAKDYEKVRRLIAYTKEQGYNCCGIDVPYVVTFTKTVNVKGIPVQGIKGNFDFVLEKEKDGVRTNVLLQAGKLIYSERARNLEKKPENAVELLAAALAVPDKDVVALWSLKNKDDKGGTLPAFESRKGKNTISFCVERKEDLLRRLFSQLAKPCENDCDDCIYKSVCQMPDLLQEVEESTDEKKEQRREKHFTDAQRRVIDHVNGPMCCIAVPGAGKTTALTERLVSLCKKGIRPQSILMLTFTKKAAAEIRERVSVRLAAEGIRNMPEISTYNAFGYAILKDNPTYLGKRLRLADEIDQLELIKECVLSSPKIEDVSYSGIYSEYGLINQLKTMFDQIKKDGEDAFRTRYGERKDVEGILKVYAKYTEEYEKAGYISYDDQICLAAEMLNNWPELLAGYAQKYEYIMVDEFQDSSEEQVDLIYSIAHIHDNIVVVGDDDQSVYGWRGGSSKFMLQFQKDFPKAEMVYMEDNFRSRNGILAVADALIAGNGSRFEKKIKGHDASSMIPIYVKSTSRDFLWTLVEKALKSGMEPGEIAVLARNNKRLNTAYEILSPMVKCATPKDFLVEDAVFQTVYDLLNLYFRGLDQDESLYRVFKRLSADVTTLNLGRGESLYSRMRAKEVIPELINGKDCLKQLQEMKPTAFTRAAGIITECIGYAEFGKDLTEILRGMLMKMFGMESHPVVNRLLEIAEDKAFVRLKDLYCMMDNMILFRSTERVGYDPSRDAVNLLTCHDSKGKEFRTVFIYGAEDFENEPEEIRVLYVAMTRAMKNLYLIETSRNQNEDVIEKIRPYVKIVSE